MMVMIRLRLPPMASTRPQQPTLSSHWQGYRLETEGNRPLPAKRQVAGGLQSPITEFRPGLHPDEVAIFTSGW